MTVGKQAFYQRLNRCLVVSSLSNSKLGRMGMNGLGDLTVLSSIAITDHAGFHGSMNFQFQLHLAASCVITAVLDWLLFGLLYSFRPLSHFL